jgi:pantothenate kinase
MRGQLLVLLCLILLQAGCSFCSMANRVLPASRLDLLLCASSDDGANPVDALMIDTYDDLARKINARREELFQQRAQLGGAESKAPQQLIVGLVGPPGVGKSTSSAQLAKRIPRSTVVPMDGYHFSKKEMAERWQGAELDRATTRRGAHWTFDGEAFVSALAQLRVSGNGLFPSFNHGQGDPVQGGIEVRGWPTVHACALVTK